VKYLSDLSELQWRILAELEEAGIENIAALAATVTDLEGVPVDWQSMKMALIGLINFDQVRASLRASHANRIRTLKSGVQLAEIAKRGAGSWPMSKEESLGLIDEVDAALTADPEYKTSWIDIVTTDVGKETSERILDRRGYQWWKRRR
jgi:hypothetical protein